METFNGSRASDRTWRHAVARALLFGQCLLAFAVVGCSKPPAASRPETASMKALGILYGKYLGAHRGKTPPDEQAFLQYVTTKEPDLLQQFRISDPSKMLLSPRDQQPLVVVYGTGTLSETSPIVAYEDPSSNGLRLIVRTTGAVQELTEAEFNVEKPNG